MGPTALLPLRRKWCSGFLSPLKIQRPRSGLNPRTLGPVASTLTTSPPRSTYTIFIPLFKKMHITAFLTQKIKTIKNVYIQMERDMS
jgi:hypothetical protein